MGRFWEAVIGGERLTDEPEGFETRLTIEGGPVLDLCFQRVPERPSEPLRLHLDLLGGTRQTEEVERLLGLGARHLDIGQHDVPWVVLADPEGNPLLRHGGAGGVRRHWTDRGTSARLCGPGQGRGVLVLADRLDRGARHRNPDPAPPVAARSAARAVPGAGAQGIGQESTTPRRSAGDWRGSRRRRGQHPASVAASELRTDWGDLPWRSYTDPSGNEFCVLPASSDS